MKTYVNYPEDPNGVFANVLVERQNRVVTNACGPARKHLKTAKQDARILGRTLRELAMRGEKEKP